MRYDSFQQLTILLVVLFDALTEFLKKQALKGANEIIGDLLDGIKD